MGNHNYSEISHTAVLCAHVRANYTDIYFAKQIYDAIENKPKTFIPDLLIKCDTNFRAQLSTLEGRYLAINDALSGLENSNILEIASGLSTRGLEYSNNGRTYTETDLPDMIKTKKGLLKKITSDNILPNHNLYQLNALDQNALLEMGNYIRQLSPENSIALVQEGLMMYLTESEQKRLRDNVATFLKKHSPDGTWVTTDFSTREPEKNMAYKLVVGLMLRKTKRKFRKFSNDSEATRFLEEGGLVGTPLPVDPYIDKLSYTRKMNLTSKQIAKVSNYYRAWQIKLK